MPRARGGGARGLELEAALAAEAAWELREAAASMAGAGSLDMDVDSPHPQLPTMEVSGDGLIPPPDPFSLNQDNDEQYLEVSAANPIEDSSERVSKLIALQKRLSQPNKGSLASQVRKRMRSASTVNSSPTPVSPVQKRSRRSGSKRSLVWNHFDTDDKGQIPTATCKYCGQVYACDRSTHGTSSLWNHLRTLCPLEPLKGQELQRKNPGTPKQSYSIEDCRKALAEMVLIDEMPFKTVEGEGFKRYSKVLQPRFEPPSRVTVARDCMERYFIEKPKLKQIMRNQRICLTTDTWTL